MKYRVQVPLGKSLQFPDLCPFTDTPAPRGVVRLKQTRTLWVVPLPGGIYNRYATTRLRIPADRQVAAKALRLEVLMWASLLGGIAIGFLMVATDHSKTPNEWPFLVVMGGPILALGFRIARYVTLRRVRIGRTDAEMLELLFDSELYARKFSELNRLPLAAD